jgi:hypothetical protein
MPTVRLRVTASEDDTRALMNALVAIEGIEHVAAERLSLAIEIVEDF